MLNRLPLSKRVTLEKIAVADRALIDGLVQFYIYDFSEMSPITDTDFDFGPDGRYDDLPGIDDHWQDECALALVIRYEGRSAGFALINNQSRRGSGYVERGMGEFFVARQYRHTGVADEALRQVLAAYTGRWEVAVVARNTAAKAFWPRAIAAAANVSGLTCVEGDGTHWNGPIWCFDAN